MGQATPVIDIETPIEALSALCEKLANKDQANGYVGTDEEGYANLASVAGRDDTLANLLALVPTDAELSAPSNYPGMLFVGNGTLQYPIGLASPNVVPVYPVGTPAQNGAAILAAYARAKTMNPSATNRIQVRVQFGHYTFDTNDLDMDTNYIDLVGEDWPILDCANGGTINLQSGLTTFRFAGFRIARTPAAVFILINSTDLSGAVVEDLEITAGTPTSNLCQWSSGVNSLAGTFRRIRTSVNGTFGAKASTSFAVTASFENCEATADNCFGSSTIAASPGLCSGDWRNVRIVGSYALATSGRVERCHFRQTGASRVGLYVLAAATAKVYHTTIITNGSGTCVDRVGSETPTAALAAVIAGGGSGGSSGLGASVTNSVTGGVLYDADIT